MFHKTNIKVRTSKTPKPILGSGVRAFKKTLILVAMLALAFLTPMIANAEINRPPIISHIGDVSVEEGINLQFVVSASDPDGDPVTITCQNPPDGAYYNSTTSIFIWTSGFNQAGSYSVTFNATDGRGGIALESVAVTVLDVNRPPMLDPIGNKTVAEGSLLAFNLTATDPDGDLLNFFALGLPELARLNYTTGEFSWIPDYDQAGTFKTTFIVFDGKGGNSSETVFITVEDVNRSPRIQAIDNMTVAEGSQLMFYVRATDPDGDVVQFSATGLPSGSTLNSTTGRFAWTPSHDQAGDYHMTFVARDEKGGVDSENASITVLDVNRPPTLSPIGNKTVNVGSTLNFAILATDPDGNGLQFAASNIPQGANLSTTGIFAWTPTESNIGLHKIDMTVSDGKGGVDSETIFILVAGINHAPVLSSIGNKTVEENSALIFTVTATDSDGDAITFAITALPQGATFDSMTGIFQWTPSTGQVGTYTPTFTASDGKGGKDTETITIAVKPASHHHERDDDDEPDDDHDSDEKPTELIQHLIDDVKDCRAKGAIDNKGIAKSLTAKLESAKSKLEAGNVKSASNIMQAFINHVEAQSGKHIRENAAESLIEDASEILNELQER